MRAAVSLLIGILIVAFTVGPVLLYLDRLESQGKIDPPDWLVMPTVIVLIGLVVLIAKIAARLIDRRSAGKS